MRIILLHQYFKTPEEGGGIRSWYLANALKQAGHDVVVVTAWNRKKKDLVETNGITVHYLPVFYSNNLGKVRRMVSFLLFAISAVRTILSLPKVDLLYAISTPLSTGAVALYIKHKAGIPFVFEVGDLWPEVPVQMGIVKNPGLVTSLKKVAFEIYSQAQSLVAMSPAMLSYFHVLGHSEKTRCVTNFADLNFEGISNRATAGEFRVVYTGTIGRANQLDFLLSLAEEAQLRQLSRFRCIVMGEGAEKARLQKLAAKKKLTNVEFVAHGSKAAAFKMLSTASMAYLSFAPFDMLWTGSPNKYFDALAIGKPVLCNFGGWIADEIETKQCGIVYDGQQPGSFFDRYWTSLQDADLLDKMGKNALQLARARYSLEVQLPEWLKLFGR